ncbi:hypothetical protein [Melittangium boletus]|uniref:hypothetical protein n=1 Tax=Melittangium boletus TaxID=83453 RepID=UPI0012FD200D|nr:hypothetical protein [Melittangium boletus]
MKRTEWERRIGSPGRVLGVLALVGALLTGCESQFVDPHPPELELLQREQTVALQDTPLVYGILFDLNLPDASECARIKSRLQNTLSTTLLPAGRQGMEMAVQDLSPDCRQQRERMLRFTDYEAGLREAERRFGAGRIKPVLFYFNNVNLPLPLELQSQLSLLRSWYSGPALLWALTTPEVRQGLGFDHVSPWTYSADPRLTASLEEAARAQLPLLQLETPPPEGYPLLTPQELLSVREFKGCTAPSNLKGIGFTYGRQAVKVDPARPPRIQVLLSTLPPPVPRTQKPAAQTLRFTMEVCRANCDRLYPTPPDDELLVWNTTPLCALQGDSR